MLSPFVPWCAETCINAHESEGEKPHQGVATKKSAHFLGRDVCNSTTALGLRGQAALNRIRSRCTGKERDTESGLDYFGARYYSNGLGRFITPDWAAKAVDVPYAEFSDPQSLNLYSYVRNVPTTKFDADGHCLEDACVIEGIVVGGMEVSAYLASPSGQQALRAGAHLFDAATSWAAQKGLQGIHALKNVLSSKAAPASNPAPGTQTKTSDPARPGTLGKPDHQQTVKDEAARIGGKTEVKIPTPGGSKESRRADAAETNEDGSYKAGGKIVQVIRPTPAGNAPQREKQAAQDIENATGVKPELVPVRPVPDKQEQK
ncbi:MAG TPA: RHS repeat-associated core domain-containing protein [Candidatus Angelobacter sp.]|nr:RHS repeat-associated core domain-containing protein [Candidatus Angelobacter sp.]